MSIYTFSTSPGFATAENITLINNDIDPVIGSRTSTTAMGDSLIITFSLKLSSANIALLKNIINDRDNIVSVGQQNNYGSLSVESDGMINLNDQQGRDPSAPNEGMKLFTKLRAGRRTLGHRSSIRYESRISSRIASS